MASLRISCRRSFPEFILEIFLWIHYIDIEQWKILQLKLIPTIEILTETFVKLKQKLKNVDLDLFSF